MRKLFYLIFCALLLAGCHQLTIDFEEDNVNDDLTINDYFDKEISKYTEATINEEIECISGECPKFESELKTVEKDCYFCDVSKIVGNELRLIHDKGQSGSQDASFGCIRKYDGPIMDGFEIVEKNESIIKVRGDIKFYYSQKSMVCDKEKDPGCDNQTYGTCDGDDYSQVSTRTVEMVFKSD